MRKSSGRSVWEKRLRNIDKDAEETLAQFPGLDISELVSFKYFEADPGDCTVFGKRHLHLSDPNVTGTDREIAEHIGNSARSGRADPRATSRAAFVVRVAVAQDGLLRMRRIGNSDNMRFSLGRTPVEVLPETLKPVFQPDNTTGSEDFIVLNVSSPRVDALLQEMMMASMKRDVWSVASAFFH